MYIIRGIYYGSICYYVDSKIDDETGMIIRTFTANVETATKFKSVKKAESVCSDLHDDFFIVYRLCPICHREIIGYPAISRKDNKTKICSDCGVNEAISAFYNYQKK